MFLYSHDCILLVIGEGLQKASNNIKTAVQKASKAINTNTNEYTNEADYILAEYGPYRFYLGLGVCTILLIVSCCGCLPYNYLIHYI